MLLHFVQDNPGDFVPLEDISEALGVSTNAQEGQMPSVRPKNNKICKKHILARIEPQWLQSLLEGFQF